MSHGKFITKADLDAAVKSIISFIQSQQEPEQLLSRKEASVLLGVSLVTLNKWSKEGKIRARRIGTRVRYKKSELLKAIQ